MVLGKLPFARKVTLIVTVMIALSGVSITGVAAYQFRRELYAQEYSAAFTVYMAAANYLTAHNKTHRGTYQKKSLDFVFRKKFLQLEGEQGERITHRPSNLAVYDGRGILAYEYADSSEYTAPRYIPRGDLPVRYREQYDGASKSIHVAGLVSPDGDVPGFVFITFASDIQAKIATLFLNTFLVMAVVILIAVGLSSWMTSHALAPVQSLIQAAKRVRRGDMDQHVIIAGEDEIGLLAQTFNEMVGSLGRRIALMHRMQEWTMELSRIFDIRNLYNSFMEMCLALSPAEAFRLYVFNDKAERMELVVSHDTREDPTAGPDALIERACRDGRTRFLDKDGNDLPHAESTVELAIPLIASNKPVGAMWIGRPRAEGHYEDETVTILQTMAQHAAAAIENVKLYSELSEKERYEREMALARQIQAGMLPVSVPEIAGFEIQGLCRPAFEVGGDYFDYVAAGDGRWYVVAGDVSGKGVPAAMIVSIVRTLIHTCVQFETSIPKVLRWVNRNLTPDLSSDMFVTLSVAALTPGQPSLHFLRAGHEPALVVRKATGRMERVAPSGTAMGLLEMNAFDRLLSEDHLDLQSGDVLLLYTDGVTEAMRDGDQEFGVDRLEQAFARCAGHSATDTVNDILAAVDRFTQGAAQHDDITLVAIRKT